MWNRAISIMRSARGSCTLRRNTTPEHHAEGQFAGHDERRDQQQVAAEQAAREQGGPPLFRLRHRLLHDRLHGAPSPGANR